MEDLLEEKRVGRTGSARRTKRTPGVFARPDYVLPKSNIGREV